MGKYPIFVVSEYYDVLEKIYGWSHKQIHSVTGLRGEMLQSRSLQRYPNDRHVLSIIRVLDGLHYFRDKQLRMGEHEQRLLWQMQAPHISMKLLIAELRGAATPSELFHCAARRLGRISNNHKLWIETTRAGLRMCHRYVYAEENFSGAQRTWLFLLKFLREVFEIDKQSVKVTFPVFGIRDADGFLARAGCAVDYSGGISTIELGAGALSRPNPRFNAMAAKAVTEALDDVLVEVEDDSMETAVERLLESHLTTHQRSLDIEAVVQLLGISRSTLHRRLAGEGCSFRELRIRTRLTHAASLLRDSERDIAGIGSLLGYSDASAFRRAFKGHNGCNPLEYRARHR